MTRFFYVLGFLLASLLTMAQTDDFENDIEKLLAINGSSAAYDMAFDQMVAQFKMMKTEAPDEVWKQVRTEVFDTEIEELTKQLIPVYKKHFTHDDIKELIAFYESPLGQQMTDATGKISKETMQMAQTWGMQLGGKINTFLQEKGY
ncbi:DUF2059 domain-containing protein [Maribellus maritimus]|uniref:DUF2059 domain-containing protein n=1 Tax=Maribellus maritimus TaxID=2870838 RepID=UPI001EEC7FD5|nr:DUF2059 domain-containing protein [Maribellus maritimus]MCG6187379.1 DUF2059 domain-containing protein [Maribellus maritimus]